jgi:hypothetical protein
MYYLYFPALGDRKLSGSLYCTCMREAKFGVKKFICRNDENIYIAPSEFMSSSTDFRDRMHSKNTKKYDIDHRAALFGSQYAARRDDPELVCFP